MAWRSPQAATQDFLHLPVLKSMQVPGRDDRHLRNGLREGVYDRLRLLSSHVEFVYELALLVDACLDALQAADTRSLM